MFDPDDFEADTFDVGEIDPFEATPHWFRSGRKPLSHRTRRGNR